MKRRTFLKIAGLSLVSPGFTISDIIPKAGPKDAIQTQECLAFGEFLADAADMVRSGKPLRPDGGILIPKRFSTILARTAKKAGILGRLKSERLSALCYVSEELLEDKTALGDFVWRNLNSEISYQGPYIGNRATAFQAKTFYSDNEQVFRFTLRAR